MRRGFRRGSTFCSPGLERRAKQLSCCAMSNSSGSRHRKLSSPRQKVGSAAGHLNPGLEGDAPGVASAMRVLNDVAPVGSLTATFTAVSATRARRRSPCPVRLRLKRSPIARLRDQASSRHSASIVQIPGTICRSGPPATCAAPSSADALVRQQLSSPGAGSAQP